MTAIRDVVVARSRAGEAAAIPSVRPARPEVIGASLRLARRLGRATLDAPVAAFRDLGRIGGLAVQPGAEFGAVEVHHLPPGRDPGRRDAVAHRHGAVIEARSTDSRRAEASARLARLGFAFRKVGPAPTFAWREGIYALDRLAQVAGWIGRDLPDTMESAMPADPGPRQRHLDAGAGELRLRRHYSGADRIRHYRPRPHAQAAVARLRGALAGRRLPDPLLQQGFAPAVPDLAEAPRAVLPAVDALLQAAVQEALAPRFYEARA